MMHDLELLGSSRAGCPDVSGLPHREGYARRVALAGSVRGEPAWPSRGATPTARAWLALAVALADDLTADQAFERIGGLRPPRGSGKQPDRYDQGVDTTWNP